MNNKQNWLVAIAVVVVLIIIGVVIQRSTNVAKAPEVVMNSTSTTSTVVQSTGSTSSSALSVTENGHYGNSFFSFDYPTSWTILKYSPFSMTNFKGKYIDEDVIPAGGAEIDVVTTTVQGSDQEIMTTELMSATNVMTTNVTVDSIACNEAKYDNTYTNGTASKDIAVYCQQGKELWKIYLSYRADDSTGAAHITDFNNVLSSMKLL